MKKLHLQTAAYRFLVTSFKEWLDVLGYAPSTVKSLPNCIKEFLHYLESQGLTHIHQIDTPIIQQYYRALSQRSNQRRGGGLSNNYLNVHLNALDRLLEYLRKQARIPLPAMGISHEVPNPEPIQPLTPGQIGQLYEASTVKENEYPTIAMRDRAMLAIFYDCGLRCNEGVSLNVGDIHFDNRLIQVKHGKGGQARFVPFGKGTAKHLISYTYDARPALTTHNQEALFINIQGTRATGLAMNRRLKLLQERTDDPILQQQSLHLHVLRHSIATHLLYEGMSLEKVGQFLGHKSLESTQIYTHLVQETEPSDYSASSAVLQKPNTQNREVIH